MLLMMGEEYTEKEKSIDSFQRVIHSRYHNNNKIEVKVNRVVIIHRDWIAKWSAGCWYIKEDVGVHGEVEIAMLDEDSRLLCLVWDLDKM